MKKVAIISFFHTESSLCLTKYLAKQGVAVDFYYVANLLHDRKGTSDFEYPNAKRLLGNHLLKPKESPEIYEYMEKYPVRIFLTRIIHHSRYPILHHFLIKLFMLQIKYRKYEAINIVGQSSWIEDTHEVFKNENLIHTFHEIGNKEGVLHPLVIVTRAIVDKSKVILHSQSMYERFLHIPGADSQKTTMIPFGKFETCRLYVKEMDLKLPFCINKPILLFYGYIAPYKGLDILAEAIEKLKNIWSRFNIVVAGNGEDPSLQYFRTLPNSFVMNRFLSNDEMMNLIRMSSIILLPYKSASQTGIVPTCTLYGKPVIATTVGAFPENITDGKNGLLVPPNNPAKFAEAIERLLNNKNLLQILSQGALQYGCDDQFNWDEIAKRTLKFYEGQ